MICPWHCGDSGRGRVQGILTPQGNAWFSPGVTVHSDRDCLWGRFAVKGALLPPEPRALQGCQGVSTRA